LPLQWLKITRFVLRCQEVIATKSSVGNGLKPFPTGVRS
jgi:hypothetical protein